MEGDAELQDLYREVLLDYFRSTRHRGRVASPDIESQGINPLCGDEVVLTVSVRGGVVEDCKIDGHGCVIFQSSAAMMSEAVKGQTLEEASKLAEGFKRAMLGQSSFDDLPDVLDEARALEGVQKYPARIKCALLSWNTLLLGVRSHKEGKKEVQYQEK